MFIVVVRVSPERIVVGIKEELAVGVDGDRRLDVLLVGLDKVGEVSCFRLGERDWTVVQDRARVGTGAVAIS